MHFDDIWMFQTAGGFGFLLKAHGINLTVAGLRQEQLERNISIEREIVRLKDNAHTAAAEFFH